MVEAAIHRVAPRSRVSLRSPGTREIGGARSEPLAAVSTHDVNSAVFFVPAARLCARVCPSVRLGLGRGFGVEPAVALAAIPAPAIPFHPERGVDGAPTGHSFVLSRVRGATSEPCGAACPVANGTSLGAPPGDFRPGTDAAASGSERPEPPAICPRQTAKPAGQIPDLPRQRFAPQPGDAPTPRSAVRIVSGDAPSERGCKSYTINSLRSQWISSNRSQFTSPPSVCAGR